MATYPLFLLFDFYPFLISASQMSAKEAIFQRSLRAGKYDSESAVLRVNVFMGKYSGFGYVEYCLDLLLSVPFIPPFCIHPPSSTSGFILLLDTTRIHESQLPLDT